MTNLKLMAVIAAGFSIGVGLVAYALSFVFVPAFTMTLPMMMIPLAPIFLGGIFLLIKES